MDLLTAAKAAILGVIEGLTEFIPVSSTGHLIIGNRLLGYDDPGEVFTFAIQLGAILAVCWAYREKLWTTTRGVVAGDAGTRRFTFGLILACLPAAIVGLPANKLLETHVFTDAVELPVIASTLFLGGLFILWAERRPHANRHGDAWQLPWRIALAIGCCQLLAMLPGVSRSGATIIGALLLGCTRTAATEFSFFLAIPVMLGTTAVKFAKHHEHLTADRLGEIAIGFVVSFLVSLVVVRWLLRFVAGNTFAPFAWYRLAAGLALAALLAAGILR
jgi:undecaprenyl-diphosphatase